MSLPYREKIRLPLKQSARPEPTKQGKLGLKQRQSNYGMSKRELKPKPKPLRELKNANKPRLNKLIRSGFERSALTRYLAYINLVLADIVIQHPAEAPSRKPSRQCVEHPKPWVGPLDDVVTEPKAAPKAVRQSKRKPKGSKSQRKASRQESTMVLSPPLLWAARLESEHQQRVYR
eukprot:m.40381 g.40381  ORF g.40381 m.40381 type:complete len:176 (+) comp12742_c0_seq10:985-1512(+)